MHYHFLNVGTAKRQKRRLQTNEDDTHLDWGKDQAMIFAIRKTGSL